MRLIDADALIVELQKDETKFDNEANDARNAPSYTESYSEAMWSRANGIRDAIIEIYDAPSIDIVRCGECKYWNDADEYCEWFAKAHTSADDFCSYGEVSEIPTGSERSSE